MSKQSAQWTTYEPVEARTGRRLVSDEIVAAGVEGAEKAISVMRVLEDMIKEHGWQKARLAYKYHKGKKSEPRVVHKDGILWLLKCKPSCWRLYFYVHEQNKQIVYLHAVCKKKDKENAQDVSTAVGVIDSIASGESSISAFKLRP